MPAPFLTWRSSGRPPANKKRIFFWLHCRVRQGEVSSLPVELTMGEWEVTDILAWDQDNRKM